MLASSANIPYPVVCSTISAYEELVCLASMRYHASSFLFAHSCLLAARRDLHMLQNFFNALFSDCGENNDRYLECTISPSEIHTGDTLVLEEHEDGSCTGRAIRVQVTGIIEDAVSDKVKLPISDNEHTVKQKTETWSIPTFMI